MFDDVCKWKTIGTVWHTDCGHEIDDSHTSCGWAFCPYCGRRIFDANRFAELLDIFNELNQRMGGKYIE